MEILLLPLSIMGTAFIVMPATALIPAGVFSWLYIKSRSWPCLVATLLWLVYTLYEFGMYLRILCSGECNIRVDLLLIYPLLLLMSLMALIVFFLKMKITPHQTC